VVLIALQSALTGILAILIVYNAVIACCKQNPHRKRRKEMGKQNTSRSPPFSEHAFTNNPTEKMQRDTLTPLDARNSLLLERNKSGDAFSLNNMPESKLPLARNTSPERYHSSTLEPANPYASPATFNRPLTPSTPYSGVDQSSERLLNSAAPMGREPTLPNVGGYGGGYPSYRAPPRSQY
jgi:hypothetical protein